MVRGVNKRIIEIVNTGNESFERVFVVLREGVGSSGDPALGEQADRYVRELSKQHNPLRASGERAMPFVTKKTPPDRAGKTKLATESKRSFSRGRWWSVPLIAAVAIGTVVIAGLIALLFI